MRNLAKTALVVLAFLGAGAANAATIGFDGAVGGNPGDPYYEDGYKFVPNKGTNGECPLSADAPCAMEVTQGTITTMTRDGGGTFEILGFDFLLVGSGNNNNNQNNTSSMFLTGFLSPGKVFEIKMGDALGTFANYILTTVTGVSTGNVTFNEGYRVVFRNSFFAGLNSADFTTSSDSGNAQARIDNIVTPSAVPVPAAGLLLLGGLGGLAALRRRKAA